MSAASLTVAVCPPTRGDDLCTVEAAAFNLETLIDVIDGYAEEASHTEHGWLPAKIKSHGDMIHRLCIVARDEQMRAQDALQRVLDGIDEPTGERP